MGSKEGRKEGRETEGKLTILEVLIKLHTAVVYLFEAFNQEFQNICHKARMDKGFEESS